VATDPLLPPSQLQPAPRVPRHLLLRFLVLVLIVGTGFAVLRWSPLAGWLNKETITAGFERLRDTWWAPALLVLSYVVLCPLGVPATPMMIAGGVVWGVLRGSVYNVLGIFLGAASTYWLGRVLGRDFVLHLFGRRLRRVERMVARRGGFWSLAGVRFLPLPFALVNYCAAFVGIRPGLFLSSTALGLSLTVPIFTYFAHALSQAATGRRSEVYIQLGVALALLMSVTFLPRLWQARKRKERYRAVLAKRRTRRVPA
jgi:phospholipase D1/2